ncbi:hypothetical protein BDP27DRAFT_1368445 [Rhodocollybia butyracea]|uniref:Uncharacterized protein n=1 Tax=Rhodocollybia butyracea TaxID=206335 RepID=A0A9P5U1J0_9AGAR|nr:hypothetical protein BDP27DRAFT_1368445 [Rhodocollybia butyracea]
MRGAGALTHHPNGIAYCLILLNVCSSAWVESVECGGTHPIHQIRPSRAAALKQLAAASVSDLIVNRVPTFNDPAQTPKTKSKAKLTFVDRSGNIIPFPKPRDPNDAKEVKKLEMYQRSGRVSVTSVVKKTTRLKDLKRKENPNANLAGVGWYCRIYKRGENGLVPVEDFEGDLQEPKDRPETLRSNSARPRKPKVDAGDQITTEHSVALNTNPSDEQSAAAVTTEPANKETTNKVPANKETVNKEPPKGGSMPLAGPREQPLGVDDLISYFFKKPNLFEVSRICLDPAAESAPEVLTKTHVASAEWIIQG